MHTQGLPYLHVLSEVIQPVVTIHINLGLLIYLSIKVYLNYNYLVHV